MLDKSVPSPAKPHVAALHIIESAFHLKGRNQREGEKGAASVVSALQSQGVMAAPVDIRELVFLQLAWYSCNEAMHRHQ